MYIWDTKIIILKISFIFFPSCCSFQLSGSKCLIRTRPPQVFENSRKKNYRKHCLCVTTKVSVFFYSLFFYNIIHSCTGPKTKRRFSRRINEASRDRPCLANGRFKRRQRLHYRKQIGCEMQIKSGHCGNKKETTALWWEASKYTKYISYDRSSDYLYARTLGTSPILTLQRSPPVRQSNFVYPWEASSTPVFFCFFLLIIFFFTQNFITWRMTIDTLYSKFSYDHWR